MGKCGNCDKPGHNRRSCPQRPENDQQQVHTEVINTQQQSRLSTSASTKNRVASTSQQNKVVIPVPLKPPLVKNSQFLNHQLNYLEQKISSQKSFEKTIKENRDGIIQKLDNLIKIPQIETVDNFCKGCHNSGHLDQSQCHKKCGNCGHLSHNVRTCPQLEEARVKEKAEKADELPHWLNTEAKKRFKKGPTETDGNGYIYIYTYTKPKTDGDKKLFKIGMSKLEGRRRIEVQEKVDTLSTKI